METGEARFAKLKHEEQYKVLGKAGGAAYRAGAVQLKDFCHRPHQREMGHARAA